VENDITVYAASYVFTRLAVLGGFGYLFYQILRPARAEARFRTAQHRAERVPDDRC